MLCRIIKVLRTWRFYSTVCNDNCVVKCNLITKVLDYKVFGYRVLEYRVLDYRVFGYRVLDY